MARFGLAKPWIYEYVGTGKKIEEIAIERNCTYNEILDECIKHAIDPITTFGFDPAEHRDSSTHWILQYINSGISLSEIAKIQHLTEAEVLIALLAAGKQQSDLLIKGQKLLGLDVGTSRLLVAKKAEPGNIIVRAQRNAFLELPTDQITLRHLKRSSISYVELDNKRYIVGDDAYIHGHMFPHLELKRPMANGVLSIEPKALPIIKEIIGALVGTAPEGSVCAYSVPAVPVDSSRLVQYHQDVIGGILELYGYHPVIVNEGVTVANVGLEQYDLTGLALSFGGGLINAALMVKGISNLQISVSQAGDFVDGFAAKDLGLAPIQVTSLKESGEIDISKTQTTREGQAIKSYIILTIRHALSEIAKYFELGKNKPHFETPLPVAIAGGGCLIPGFLEVFIKELQTFNMPFKIDYSKVFIVPDPLTAIARGALIEAELF